MINRDVLRMDASMAAQTIFDVVGRLNMAWGIGRRWPSAQAMWASIRPEVLDEDGKLHTDIERLMDKVQTVDSPMVGAIQAVRIGSMKWILKQAE
jgi:hypothetical protein